MSSAHAFENSPQYRGMTQAHIGSLSETIALGAIGIATWALSHGYGGIVHDARLYTLQALARLNPDSLAQDVFLRYGSQDGYSIFGPVYALFIRGLGVEPAAAMLTLISQLVLMGCTWQLARRLMPASLALLATVTVIALPGIYGASQIFSFIEPFLTPRMLAEALVLASLACTQARPALALLVAAALIHPIMAGAGLAALLWTHIGTPRPRLASILIGSAAVALVAQAYLLPHGPWGSFDTQWRQLVESRAPYLFLANWSREDWVRAGVPLVTLLIAGRVLADGFARDLSRIVRFTAASGLALTLFACDMLHLAIFTQLQPWRWLWLSTATAGLLLPAIVTGAWRLGHAGRTTALLLIASWIFGSDTLALEVALGATATLIVTPRVRAEYGRLIFFGACGLFALAVVWRVASNLVFTDVHYYDPSLSLWLRQAMSFTRDGAAPVALAAVAVWLATSAHRRPSTVAFAALGVVACLCLAPATWNRWTHRSLPPSLTAHFMAWRALIPPGAAVFWPGEPVKTWLLLERPSYLSAAQAAGILFSRPAALEMARRARSLGGVSPQIFLRGDTQESDIGLGPRELDEACASSQFQYLVTGAKLDRPVLAQLSNKVWPVSGGLRLYRCALRTG